MILPGLSFGHVWTTIMTEGPAIPVVRQRCSWGYGSSLLVKSESWNTSLAVLKLMPCLRMFSRFFSGSQVQCKVVVPRCPVAGVRSRGSLEMGLRDVAARLLCHCAAGEAGLALAIEWIPEMNTVWSATPVTVPLRTSAVSSNLLLGASSCALPPSMMPSSLSRSSGCPVASPHRAAPVWVGRFSLPGT